MCCPVMCYDGHMMMTEHLYTRVITDTHIFNPRVCTVPSEGRRNNAIPTVV